MRMKIRRMLQLLATVGKTYLKFAILHTLYKILRVTYINVKMRYMWRELPGTKNDPFFQVILANFYRLYDYYTEETVQHYNAPLIKLFEGLEPQLICNTPESVRWLLKDEFKNFTKPDGSSIIFRLLREFIGKEGIFNLEHGEHVSRSSHLKWNKQRKIAAKIFTKSNFESFMHETFVDKSYKVIQVIQNEKGYIDMQEIFFKFTMDSIEKLFFGKEINSIQGDMSVYGRSFDMAHKQLMKLLEENILALTGEAFLPFPLDKLIFDISRYNTPTQKIFQENINKLHAETASFIKKAKNDPNIHTRRDILANFLNANLEFDGKPMTDEMLRHIILNFTIAGRDTTACALSWLFYELSIHPIIQEKLYREIMEKLQGSQNISAAAVAPAVSEITDDKMPYLNAVIMETLRLHPPVPLNNKCATRDLIACDGKTFVPKGTEVSYQTYSLNRRPEVYESPEDFKPERWMEIPFKEPSMYDFPVFQAGPRFCLGKDMAKIEMKLLTCMLLQKFKFSLKEGERLFYSLTLTMSLSNKEDRSESNLWLKAEPR